MNVRGVEERDFVFGISLPPYSTLSLLKFLFYFCCKKKHYISESLSYCCISRSGRWHWSGGALRNLVNGVFAHCTTAGGEAACIHARAALLHVPNLLIKRKE
jgi:hypothetical protein